MTKLTKLEMIYSRGLGDSGIKNLYNLIELKADKNNKISDINHLTNLQYLSAAYDECGINDYGIKNLTRLKVLDKHCNSKLTNINIVQTILD